VRKALAFHLINQFLITLKLLHCLLCGICTTWTHIVCLSICVSSWFNRRTTGWNLVSTSCHCRRS